jgi:VanZ family protein
MMSIHFEWRYGLVTAAWLAAIYVSSSIPDLSTTQSDPLMLLAQNLAHTPVFAVLAFCWLRTLSNWPEISGAAYAGAALAAGVCAVMDEWHQASVPGRHASIGDLCLDTAGIFVMLVTVRLTRLRADATRRSEPTPS